MKQKRKKLVYIVSYWLSISRSDQSLGSIIRKDQIGMPEIILGTDIGSQTMKLALVRQDKRFTVLGTAVVKTPEGSAGRGDHLRGRDREPPA